MMIGPIINEGHRDLYFMVPLISTHFVRKYF